MSNNDIDPQDLDDNMTAWRWAWLDEEQKHEKIQRLQDLRSLLDILLEEAGVPKPIYVHGSALWSPNLTDAKDIDLIAPQVHEVPKGLCAAGLEVNIGKVVYELNRAGAVLLMGREDAEEGSEEAEENCEELQVPQYLAGVQAALANISLQPRLNLSEVNDYKEQKLRLESLIYVAQYFADVAELCPAQQTTQLEQLQANLEETIIRINQASLKGTVSDVDTREAIYHNFHTRVCNMFQTITVLSMEQQMS